MKIYNYFKNMNQEIRLKNINETRKNFLEEIKQNELMSKNHKEVCTTLHYIKHVLILSSSTTGCRITKSFQQIHFINFPTF